jgi:hypothetical protein
MWRNGAISYGGWRESGNGGENVMAASAYQPLGINNGEKQ